MKLLGEISIMRDQGLLKDSADMEVSRYFRRHISQAQPMRIDVIYVFISMDGTMRVPGRVLLVTAHPDDECLFFTPTITTLQRLGARIFLLCLSTGNANGLGQVRRKELADACLVLKINAADLRIIDDPRQQDGLNESWDAAVVAEHVSTAVQQLAPNLILTFDGYGVSGHPNHRATYRGVAAFLVQQRSLQSTRPLEVHVLESTPLLRKYLSVFDVLPSSVIAASQGLMCNISCAPWLTWRAMKAHRSQLIWFRRLFVLFSRYTYVNTLRRI